MVNCQTHAPIAHQTASSGLALDHRGSQAVFDRQRRKIRITDQTAGHSAVDPRVLREDLVSGNVFILDILQVHLTAVDLRLVVQLSYQTADISVTDNSGVGQTDIFQFAAKSLEQARVGRVGRVDRQIIDHRAIASDLTAVALDLRIYERHKVQLRIELTPAIAFIALELDVPLLHRGGDYRRISDGSSV